jgi:hypothetical protein
MNWWAILLIAIGVYCGVSAIFDWDFFMENRRARWVSNVLTRNGARIFYVLMGLVVIGIGIAEFFRPTV